MSEAVARELERIVEGFVALPHPGGLPRQPFDPEWRSPCEVGEPDAAGLIAWRPVRRDAPLDWAGLERALEIELHPDVAAFYDTFWSDAIPVRAEEGGASLVQVWNERDFERLVGNLIGHALQKRRHRQPLTVFVALTDEDELTLAADNLTGAVVLEQSGHAPVREVAPDLATLLTRFEPTITSLGSDHSSLLK